MKQATRKALGAKTHNYEKVCRLKVLQVMGRVEVGFRGLARSHAHTLAAQNEKKNEIFFLGLQIHGPKARSPTRDPAMGPRRVYFLHGTMWVRVRRHRQTGLFCTDRGATTKNFFIGIYSVYGFWTARLIKVVRLGFSSLGSRNSGLE